MNRAMVSRWDINLEARK